LLRQKTLLKKHTFQFYIFPFEFPCVYSVNLCVTFAFIIVNKYLIIISQRTKENIQRTKELFVMYILNYEL